MPVDLANKPFVTPRTPTEQPFDPSQLTDAKAQIEYLVNTKRLSVADANKALSQYGAKLREVDGSPGYYNVTGHHSILKEFVLPASIMVGGAVGLNLLANAIAAGTGAAGAASGTGAGVSGAAPATGTGITAGSTTLGPGVGFGAGGTPFAASAGTGVASTAVPAVTGGATTAAASSMPFWQKALIGFGSDALKTYLSNRASGQANKALQAGGDKALAEYQSALGPYMHLGGQAASGLGYLMGFPGGSATAPAPMPMGNLSTMSTTGRTMPVGAAPTGVAMPRPPAQPRMMDPQGMGSLASMGGMTPAQAQTQSSYRIQAPDGEVGEIPPALLQKALQMGGKVVS